MLSGFMLSGFMLFGQGHQMPIRKTRLTQAERGRYFNAARQLRQAGVEIKILEDWLVSARAIDVYLATAGGLGSMVSQSSNGGVHYAVWVRLVARYACTLLDCRLTTRWDHNILLNSYDGRELCKLGRLDFPQAEVLNQRIEESLRFGHRGDMVEGVILATGITPIPQAFRQGMLVPFDLTFEDQFENEISVEGKLSVDRTATPKEAAVRCGTGLYGAAAASRRAMAGEGLSGPQRQHAVSSPLDRKEGAPQHNARHANDAEM
jgi:hypothetical protein